MDMWLFSESKLRTKFDTIVPPQIILQNFMFERFLQKLSLSKYRNNFIIKGGLLISYLVGLESRSTMDIDTTIKNYPLTERNLKNIFEEIIGNSRPCHKFCVNDRV